MSSKKSSGSQSASDWYQQLMNKLPAQSESKSTEKKATKKKLDPAHDEQDGDANVSTTVSTGLLLSERTDIWNAVDTITSSKGKTGGKGNGAAIGGTKRKLDQKIAKLEASTADSDDFLSSLMKDRTGDAFDDLVAQVEEQQALAKAQQKQQGLGQKKKLVKKTVSIGGTSASDADQSTKVKPAPTKGPATKEPIETKSILKKSLASQKTKSSTTPAVTAATPSPKAVPSEPVIEAVAKKQKTTDPSKTKTQVVVSTTQITKKQANPLVQLPTSVPGKPAGWTPKHGKYFADKSKIATSTKFDDFARSLPPWFLEPSYQLEIQRLVNQTNTTKKYTSSPHSQWLPKPVIVQPQPEKPIAPKPVTAQTAPAAKSQKKTPNVFEMDEIESELEVSEEEEYADEEDAADASTDVDSDAAELQGEEENENEDENEDEDDYEDEDYDEDEEVEATAPTAQIRSLPAPVSHSVLILNDTDDRVDAIRDYHRSITDNDAHSRMKTKMVIVVRDGRTANQLICKIGLRVTKHRKDRRGNSNAGLVVETKGVEMLHERYNDVQRRKALQKFQRGAVHTMIVTDQYLSMLWPFRQSIGIMVHYDVPLHQNQLNGKKSGQKAKDQVLSKEEIAKQKAADDLFTKHHTMSIMQERLGYLQRFETHFPDQFYNKVLTPISKNVQKIPNPENPFKNVSLVLLAPTRACQAYAKNMGPIYKQQYKAERTSQALADFAAKPPTQ